MLNQATKSRVLPKKIGIIPIKDTQMKKLDVGGLKIGRFYIDILS